MDILFEDRQRWPKTIAYAIVGSGAAILLFALLLFTGTLDMLAPEESAILLAIAAFVLLIDVLVVLTYEMHVVVTRRDVKLRTRLFQMATSEQTIPLKDIKRLEVFGGGSQRQPTQAKTRRVRTRRRSKELSFPSGLRGVRFIVEEETGRSKPPATIFTDDPEGLENVLRAHIGH